MPQAIIKISGNIEDFTRLDNIYKTLKREAKKLLTEWKLEITVSYEESQGEKV